jgi:hypothetical protein
MNTCDEHGVHSAHEKRDEDPQRHLVQVQSLV